MKKKDSPKKGRGGGITKTLMGKLLFSPFHAPMFDILVNRTRLKKPYSISSEAAAYHKTLNVVDMHCDALISYRNLTMHSNLGHVDLPRLAEGNVALQAFTIVTQAPVRAGIRWLPTELDAITLKVIAQRWPTRTWRSFFERALYETERLRDVEARSAGRFRILCSAEALDAYLRDRRGDPTLTAGFLGIEGLHCLEGNLDNLDRLYNAGVRMAGLVHLAGNDLGGAAHGRNNSGITPFGAAVARRMAEKGIIVDLSHASPALLDDTLGIATRPIVISHTGFKGVCNNERNLSDEHAQRVAETGGIIGVGYFRWATGGKDVASIIRMIRYGMELVGAKHLALGSDFDGAVTTPFDTSGMALITDALLREGVSHGDITDIMGENALRLLRDAL